MPIERFDYSKNNLSNLLIDCSKISRLVLNSKDIITYLFEYFEHFETKTIILEKHYIDDDFLTDYAGYYAQCFKPYRKNCCRIHFFSINISDSDIEKIILKKHELFNEKILNEHYIGFIVIKPLPDTIIGRTYLKVYEEINGRIYPIKRKYNVHLFGLDLFIKTLPFQEQDREISACATCALWSTFHFTALSVK